jgi:3-mercaptopropionate dioxygenase
MNPSLLRFTQTLDPVVACGQRSSQDVAAAAERALRALLKDADCLTADQRRSNPDRYAQHVLYSHPEGAYSVVSLVWLPGQRTPIHDHICWCVTGVLQGREEETRYVLREGADGLELTATEVVMNDVGDVSRLVPPDENIHRVSNAGDDLAISLHIYGADIATRGTSVNQVFEQTPISSAAGPGAVHSWRSATR